MKIELVKSYQPGTLLVSFAINAKKGKESRLNLTHSQLESRLKIAIDGKELSAKENESVLFRDINFEGYRHALVVGLGENLSHETFRQVAATIQSHVASTKSQSVTIALDGAISDKKKASHQIQALAEGLYLSEYSFDELKSKKTDEKKKDIHFKFVT
jgi:leucyl aminopeptidase